jgi:hypothetical protein
MNRTNPLQAFVDDELSHAGAVLDRVIDTVYQRWRHRSAHANRAEEEATRLLRTMRGNILQRTMQRLREAAEDAMREALSQPGSRRASSELEMSLLDEDLLGVDIEISRIVEAVKLAAEFELRDLRAYTSAMAGDRNVARDTNPLRPEVFARALWAGFGVLPIERRLQLRVLRETADELASRLREVYAAACFRLAEQGIKPASYRTVVPARSHKTAAELDITYARFDLRELSRSMHAALDPPIVASRGGTSAAPVAPRATSPAVAPKPAAFFAVQGEVPAGPPGGDPKVIELVNRLFEAMRADRRLPDEIGQQLLRLQPLVLRIAARESDLLDNHEHVVWRFLTRAAFSYATRVDGDDDDGLVFVEGLFDELAVADGDDSGPFASALRRLTNFEQLSLDRRIEAVEPRIEKLRNQLARTAPMSTSSAPLDIGTLDTVPVRLLPEETPPRDDRSTAWVDSRKMGSWIRALLKGEWRRLQLVWNDESGETWLLIEVASERCWALRRQALKTLAAENLATALVPRSLVRSAASRVIRSLESGSTPT